MFEGLIRRRNKIAYIFREGCLEGGKGRFYHSGRRQSLLRESTKISFSQKNVGPTARPSRCRIVVSSNFRPPFLSAFRPALVWSPFPNPPHPARIRIRGTHTRTKIGSCATRVSPFARDLRERKREREREMLVACAPAFISHDFHESYASDDELFLVTGGRAGAATKDRFQQSAMNSLKGEEEP